MEVPRGATGRAALVFAGLAVAAFALSSYLSGPGWMAVDSGNQLTQARSFAFRDDHPVLMALMWHYTDRVVPGPLGLLLVMTGWYWAGLAGLFWALPGPLWGRVLGFLFVGFFPPVFSNVPVVWKDELMQAALLMGVACFAIDSRRFRVWRYALGGAFFLVGIGARHNALAAVWPLFAIPLLRAEFLARWRPWSRWLVAMGAALALTLGLSFGLRRALEPLTVATEFWQFVPAFDLAGISLEIDENVIDADTGLLTRGMGLAQMRRFYNPEYVNPLYYCVAFKGRRCVHVFNRTHDRDKLAHLKQNWLREIRRHPLAYLKHRARVSAALLGLQGGALGIYFVENAPFNQYGIDYPPPPRTLAVLSWIEGQVSRLWFRPWLYFLIGCCSIPIAAVRFLRGASSLPLQFALSGVLYMGSLFVATGSCDYRYTVWTTLSSLLGLVALGLPALARLRQRGERPTAEAYSSV